MLLVFPMGRQLAKRLSRETEQDAAEAEEHVGKLAKLLGLGGDVLETEKQVCKRLNIEQITAQAWRRQGEGPPWVRMGRRAIRYSVRAVDEWIASRTVGAGK